MRSTYYVIRNSQTMKYEATNITSLAEALARCDVMIAAGLPAMVFQKGGARSGQLSYPSDKAIATARQEIAEQEVSEWNTSFGVN